MARKPVVDHALVVAAVRLALKAGFRWHTSESPYVGAKRILNEQHNTDLSVNRICEVWKRYGGGMEEADIEAPEVEAQPLAPAERHDADFWRKKYTAAQKEADALHHLVDQLCGVSYEGVRAPSWAMKAGKERGKTRSVPLALVSDVHYEEVISPDEILGINGFNPGICQRRMHTYFSAFCDLGSRWSEGSNVEGALVGLLGDLITGVIHEELAMTNALTSQEAVYDCSGMLIGGLRMVKEAFGRVHVVGVPGNHGRSTRKPTAKLYSRLSYDTLILKMIAREFEGDDRVTFDFGDSKDITLPIFGRTALFTHGDKMGSRGGMGFAGPMLPIIRGAKKIHEQQASVSRTPDLVCHGHWHVTLSRPLACDRERLCCRAPRS